jgi:glycosyltransferase involved in cell wall biosynthesis
MVKSINTIQDRQLPLVSVIIPTCNRNALLLECLRSVKSQTWFAIEIIVVNDGGRENPTEIADRLGGVTAGINVIQRVEHRPDARGAQVSRNVGFEQSSGEFVLFLDDDDLLAPHCIEQRARLLMAQPNVAYSVSPCTKFEDAPKSTDPLWREWHEDQDDLLLFLGNSVPWQTSGPLWRRGALAKVGRWDESLAAGHDYEFHIRALAHGLAYRRLPVPDFYWRRPRADSFSGFEAFKATHRSGARIQSFCAGLEAVGEYGRWTPVRRTTAWREAVRLAVVCRLNGGTETTARKSLATARRWNCVDTAGYLEARACILGWFELFGKLPLMAYLARRGLLRQEAIECA